MKIFKAVFTLFMLFNVALAKDTKTDFTIFEFAKVQKGSLDKKQESIIKIAIHSANSNTKELIASLNSALDSKITINELKEILAHQALYIGFPKGLNSINILNTLLKNRSKNGIVDEIGKDASKIEINDFYSFGVEVL